MAIVNRTLDITEQKKNLSYQINTAAQLITGVTSALGIVPWPGVFYGGQMAVTGVSGAPTYQVSVLRFIAGAGATTWILATGTSNVGHEYGTSGAGAAAGNSGMNCLSSASTLAILQANDLLYVVAAGGSGAAALSLVLNFVIAPTADIKYSYGLGI